MSFYRPTTEKCVHGDIFNPHIINPLFTVSTREKTLDGAFEIFFLNLLDS